MLTHTTEKIRNVSRSVTRTTLIVFLTGSAALIASSVASAQCGTGGPCSTAQSTPGCNDTTCCQIVCSVDPFCCNTAWDGACVNGANALCVQPSIIAGPVANPHNGRRYWISSSAVRVYHQNLFSSLGEVTFVSISDGVENEWLRRAIFLGNGVPAFKAFIGLNDIATEGTFVWTDSTPTTYLNWSPGEPNNAGGEDAVEMFSTSGRWNDVETLAVLPAVAEAGYPACGGSGSCFSTHGPGCDEATCCNQVCFQDPFCCNTSWDTLCVNRANLFCTASVISAPIVNPKTRSRYVLASPGTWLSAEKLALSLGGTLVSIGNFAENEWIRLNFSTFTQVNAAWIGFHDQRYENSFEWTNTAPVSFTNWNAGEPNNALGGEDAGSMLFPGGKWNDAVQTNQLFAIIEIPCSSDLDGSGGTDASDLAIMLGAWGPNASVADLNLDAAVDAADIAILLGAWGPCPTSNACFARTNAGSDQPGCTACVCNFDPFCCDTAWDSFCVDEAESVCFNACQCVG